MMPVQLHLFVVYFVNTEQREDNSLLYYIRCPEAKPQSFRAEKLTSFGSGNRPIQITYDERKMMTLCISSMDSLFNLNICNHISSFSIIYLSSLHILVLIDIVSYLRNHFVVFLLNSNVTSPFFLVDILITEHTNHLIFQLGLPLQVLDCFSNHQFTTTIVSLALTEI